MTPEQQDKLEALAKKSASKPRDALAYRAFLDICSPENILSLLADIRATQWQPIETAPKDGSFVWLLMRDIYSDKDPGGTQWKTAKAWFEGGRWWGGQSSHWEPVYWKPDETIPPSTAKEPG